MKYSPIAKRLKRLLQIVTNLDALYDECVTGLPLHCDKCCHNYTIKPRQYGLENTDSRSV